MKSLHVGRRILASWMALLLCCFALPTVSQGEQIATAQENFYQHVNGDWLNSNEVPTQLGIIGSIYDLQMAVTQSNFMMMDTALLMERDKRDDAVGHMLALYRMALDMKYRDKLGLDPIRPYLNAIEGIRSVQDILPAMVKLYPVANTFLYYDSSQDPADSDRMILNLSYGSLTLGDKSYYDTTHGESAELAALRIYYGELFRITGASRQEAERYAADAIEIEQRIAAVTYSTEEAEDVRLLLNRMLFRQMEERVKTLDIMGFFRDTGVPVTADTEVMVGCPPYFDLLDDLLTQENLLKIKSFMMARTLAQQSANLHTPMAEAATDFQYALYGYEGSGIESEAYQLAESFFPHAMGDLYVQFFFTSDARKEVTEIAEHIVGVYKERVRACDWMSEATKEKALLKLDNIAYKIGYSDNYVDPFADFTFTPYKEGGNLMVAFEDLERCWEQHIRESLTKPYDRTQWEIPPQTVNAFYSPYNNEILFPAAFLQAPFFDPNVSASANYGAIGTVIAHEVAHAFDPNGALFDERGNMADWWTERDRAAYDQRTAALVAQYNAYTYRGKNVNSKQTLSENVADLEGLFCALEAAQQLPDFNADEFFRSYAALWREKMLPELEDLYWIMDNHMVSELRVNMPLRNVDLFYQTYDVQPGDTMYLAPDQRVRIW